MNISVSGGGRSGVHVEFSSLSFYFRSYGDLGDEEVDRVCQFLHNRVQNQENTQLFQLTACFKAFKRYQVMQLKRCLKAAPEYVSTRLKVLFVLCVTALPSGARHPAKMSWTTSVASSWKAFSLSTLTKGVKETASLLQRTMRALTNTR